MLLIRFALVILFIGFAGLTGASVPAEAAGSYAQYARSLLQKLPENSGARPDLETYLDKLVSSYRQANGRKGLIASDMMREAARAQAADMMFAGKSSHKSRAGHSFDTRFGAFVEAAELYKARGENAASDRKKGPADMMKAKAVFDLWLDSSGHRRNLMKRDYEYVSTGVIERGDELWAVQIFWSKPVPPNSNPLIIGIQ
jgi:uncharacterized protein YkwD